tara:strand:- start:11 stop:112 length:102 start_codon:yes stop_codon:yes gene_type:complete
MPKIVSKDYAQALCKSEAKRCLETAFEKGLWAN